MSSAIPVAANYVLIESDQALAKLCTELAQQPVIALDTEFVRENSYYPHLGLFQVAVGHDCWLVDPLALNDLSPFLELLENPNVLKVLHACSEDLELCYFRLGVKLQPFFDTQIAASLLGLGMSMGYQRLIDHYAGLKLPKDMQRSDWRARPLSPKQLEYAALDVYFLTQVYEKQARTLREKGRYEWLEEDTRRLLKKVTTRPAPEDLYLSVKGAGKLETRALNALQLLAEWRDAEARKEDIPKGFIFKDKVLVQIAQEQPTTAGALHNYDGVRHSSVRSYGDKVLRLLEEAKGRNVELAPAQTPIPPVYKPLVKELQQVVSGCAEEYSLPAEMLCNKRDIVAMINHVIDHDEVMLPEHLKGWRLGLVGDSLMNRLEQEL